MRTLCLDVGEKRIGVAVTDPLDLTAQAVETIPERGFENDLKRIKELCAFFDTKHLLLGLPLNMNGSAGFQSERIKSFGARLKEAGFLVRYQDERLTTQMAKSVLLEGDVRRGKRKQYIDQLAATYILQSFLDAGGWKDETGLDKNEKNKIRLFGSEVWYMSEKNEMNNELDMEVEQENVVELVDEDGNAVKFEHLMTLEHKGKVYICLVPLEEMEDVEEDELVIMRIQQDDDGKDFYSTIEDDNELQEVFDKYLEIAEADE